MSKSESKIIVKRVKAPLFEIVSDPTIRMADLKRRGFGIFDRYKSWAEQVKDIIKKHNDEAEND